MAVDPKKQTYYSNNQTRVVGDLTRLAEQLGAKDHDPVSFIDTLFECLAAAKPTVAFDGEAMTACVRPVWDSVRQSLVQARDAALKKEVEAENEKLRQTNEAIMAELAALRAQMSGAPVELPVTTTRGRAKA